MIEQAVSNAIIANRYIPSNIIIITDIPQVFDELKNKVVTTILIKAHQIPYDDINMLLFFINNSSSLIAITKDKHIISDLIIHICYVIIRDYEPNEIMHVLKKELLSIDELIADIKDSFNKKTPYDIFMTLDTSITHRNSSLIEDIDGGIYAKFVKNMNIKFLVDFYGYFVDQWRSFYEPLLSKKYISDSYFKNFINDLNYRRRINGPYYQLLRPIMLYVCWLLYYIGDLDKHSDNSRLLEFVYSVGNYMFQHKGLLDKYL